MLSRGDQRARGGRGGGSSSSWRSMWRATPPHLRVLAVGSGVVGSVYVANHVETVPVTGRRRVMFLSPATEERMGEHAAQEIMRRGRVLPPSHPMSRAVQRVGRRVVEQAKTPAMKWQFHVIESPDPNAFCLPGGKVFVHTGLFKILSGEDTLAAVLFHEAAHGIARHGAETISFSLLAYGLLALVFPGYNDIVDMLMRIAVDLPYSRKLELEADAIGLQLMAKACYDPRASLEMNAALGAQAKHALQFKYLSTHPPSAERVQALRERLLDAQEIYFASGCADTQRAFQLAMAERLNGSSE